MQPMALPTRPTSRDLGLADPGLRRSLEDMVRRRVPQGDVDDIVQNTLTEALAAAAPPEDGEALRRWVFGIARHKVIDFHRRAKRETGEVPELEAESAPHGAVDLLRWAERELPPGEGAKETLDWMLREGEGEKLESIATSEKVPAPRVRQRVTRLRKHLRARWAAQLAAVAAVIAAALYFLWPAPPSLPPEIVREKDPPRDPDAERVVEMRREALEQCSAAKWEECLRGLDEAKRLDPAGDASPAVQEARRAAAEAQTPAPAPTPLNLLNQKNAPPWSSDSEGNPQRPTPKPTSVRPESSASPPAPPVLNSNDSSTKVAPQGKQPSKPAAKDSILSEPPAPPAPKEGAKGKGGGKK